MTVIISHLIITAFKSTVIPTCIKNISLSFFKLYSIQSKMIIIRNLWYYKNIALLKLFHFAKIIILPLHIFIISIIFSPNLFPADTELLFSLFHIKIKSRILSKQFPPALP